MNKFENITDLLEEYTELKNPLLDAVLKTLAVLHKSALPFALELMLTELIYKQNTGDTCIKVDDAGINGFFAEILRQHGKHSESYAEKTKGRGKEFSPLVTDSELRSVFEECFDLIGRDETSNKPLVYDLGRLYTRRNYCYEKQIASFIKKASEVKKEQNLSEVEKGAVRSLLEVLFERSDKELANNEEFDMQKIAAAMALVSHFCIITGGPGTGKTTTVAKLLVLLQKINPAKNNILLCAPTGKAAGRMTESIKNQFKETDDPDVGTLQYSFPKVFPDPKERKEIKNRICRTAVTVDKLLGSIPHKSHKIHNSDNKIDCDILIVDEVSMVDAANFAKLCEAIRDDTRVIMLGDKDQLASVEAGSVLNDLCNDLSLSARVFDEEKLSLISSLTGYSVDKLKGTDVSDNAVQLNFSYRFARFAGIGAISRTVNEAYKKEGKDFVSLLEGQLENEEYKTHVELIEIKDSPNLHEVKKKQESLCSIIASGFAGFWDELNKTCYRDDSFTGITEEDAKKIFKKLNEFRILCSNREGLYGVRSINEEIEKEVRTNLHNLNVNASVLDSDWFIGKVILITKNNYALKISNGDVGFVAPEKNADGSAGPLKVWFGDDLCVFSVSPVFLTEYDNGDAMTIHKSQGSEYKNVCLMLSTKLNPVMTKELVYTGITRAKEHVSIYSDKQVFFDACRRRVSRESGLIERL